MIGVAAAGVILGLGAEGTRLWRSCREYRRLAWVHEWNELVFRSSAAQGREFRSGTIGPVLSPTRIAAMLRSADHEARLKRKYRRAALYPWLPVAPDPPAPE